MKKNGLKIHIIHEIKSDNERVAYTLKICNLNREDLITKRKIIFFDLRNSIKRRKNNFKLHGDKIRYNEEIKKIITDEIERIKQNREFTIWRLFLLNN